MNRLDAVGSEESKSLGTVNRKLLQVDESDVSGFASRPNFFGGPRSQELCGNASNCIMTPETSFSEP